MSAPTVARLTFETMKELCDSILDDPEITYDPGPYTGESVLKHAPGKMVIVQRSGGGLMTTEKLIDSPVWVVYVIGDQGEPVQAVEARAMNLDAGLQAVDSSQDVQGTWTLSINRVGGGPELVNLDTAERLHFTCSYVAQAESGI